MNRWSFFAGLGMIRFGMEMFEEGIKKLGGPKLRTILQNYTDSGRKATLVGTVVTGILNSSTLVSLLTLGFVSTGMMKLINAVGVLVGANIGSTATGLIVGYLGFGEFKISAFALPLIALGGVIMIFTSKKYRSYRSKLFIGFGLFFLGISFLKDNVEVMSQVFDFAQYRDMNLWIFGIIGMIITALVQSSGAVGVMTLAALSSQIITFEAGFAIILGANIGTTFTALIASLSGSIAKRQIGIANVLFNVITVFIGILLFQPFIWFTLDVLGFRDDIVIGNAIINFVFNAVTSIAFIPFLGVFTRLILFAIPEKKAVFPLQILQHEIPTDKEKYDEEQANSIIHALEYDKKYMTRQALEYILSIWGIDTKSIDANKQAYGSHSFDNEEHKKSYLLFQEELDIIFSSIQEVKQIDLNSQDSADLESLLQSFIGLNNACKAIENIREDISLLRDSIDSHTLQLFDEMKDILVSMYRTVYHLHRKKDETTMSEIVSQIRNYRNNILDHVAPFSLNGNIGDMDSSSLVNMTGELTDCIKSIERAVS